MERVKFNHRELQNDTSNLYYQLLIGHTERETVIIKLGMTKSCQKCWKYLESF